MPLVHKHAVKPALGAEFALHVVQLAAPAAEKVLPVQVEQVEAVSAALLALYLPAAQIVQTAFAAFVLL